MDGGWGAASRGNGAGKGGPGGGPVAARGGTWRERALQHKARSEARREFRLNISLRFYRTSVSDQP